MELAFRVVLTIFLTATWLVGLHWVWTNQLDFRGTVSRFFQKATPSDWVVTREQNRLYQNNAPVGEVVGDVQVQGNLVRFTLLADTSALDRTQAFEYQRYTLRVVRIEAIIGLKVDMTDTGSRTLRDVLEGVLCEIVD